MLLHRRSKFREAAIVVVPCVVTSNVYYFVVDIVFEETDSSIGILDGNVRLGVASGVLNILLNSTSSK